MSKILLLVRHGAAEHGANTTMLHDVDRELISTGIIEAARMGKFIAEKGYKADLIVSSSANRAKDTAKIFAEQQQYLAENIQIDDKIYGGGARSYLEYITKIDESVNVVLIVGHNPDISFFSEYITRPNFEDAMATAGVVIMSFEENLKWADLSSKSGKFVAYFSPYSIAHPDE
jgi:phosphohistidine phosphatase